MCYRKMEHSNFKETEGWERIRGASLVTQMVKNLPAMQETRVQSVGREDPPEKGMATHSSILAWRIPWTEETGRLSLWDHKESAMIKRLTLTFFQRTRVLNGEMFGSLFW